MIKSLSHRVLAEARAIKGVLGALADGVETLLPTELRGNELRTTWLIPEIVTTRGAMKVLRFGPRHTTKDPILFVYSLINRYYILDFMPQRSLLEYMLQQGHPCYVIDWGNPSLCEEHRRWQDYVKRDIALAQSAVSCREAIGRPLNQTESRWDQILRTPVTPTTIFGYCMGGTLALLYGAIYPNRVKSLILMATPVDFSDPTLLTQWTRTDRLDVDELVDAFGNIPTWVLEAAFRSMAPMVNVTKWRDLWQMRHKEGFSDVWRRMERWSKDNVAFPAEVFRAYLQELYQSNKLHLNALSDQGQPLRLDAIECPVLSILGTRDDIVGRESVRALSAHLDPSQLTLIESDTGHLGLTTSGKARHVIWPKISQWLHDVAVVKKESNISC